MGSNKAKYSSFSSLITVQPFTVTFLSGCHKIFITLTITLSWVIEIIYSPPKPRTQPGGEWRGDFSLPKFWKILKNYVKILFFGPNSKFLAPIDTAGEYFYPDSVIFNRKVDCFVNFSSQKFSPLEIFYSPLKFMIPSPWNFFLAASLAQTIIFLPPKFFPDSKKSTIA